MPTTYDVIVVGARCAGSATALLLARRGLRVLVLDRARYGMDTVSTHALMRGGVRQLMRWNVLDRIIGAGTPPVTKVVFHYPGDSTSITLKPTAGVDALYAPRRTVLDAVLADTATEAGAQIRFESTVTGLLRDEDGRVTGVSGHDRSGRRIMATAPLTIGADGTRSMVARDVQAPVMRAGDRKSAVLYGYWEGLQAEGFEWFYAPGHSGGMIPTNDGQTAVFAAAPPARVKQARRIATASGAFDALFRAVSPAGAERVAAAHPVGRLRGFAGVPGYVRRSWGPGWALVGDAGCFLDPLSTHGITDALRDAELLADAVWAVHAGESAEATALGAYQRTRDGLMHDLFGVVGQIAAHDWTMERLQALLVDASSAMSAQLAELEDRRAVRQ
jgi:flavin-dependent dehydrogenase